MTEQELIELWGDGTQFGMNTLGAGVMTGAMNNAFREVAVKFALAVADKAYGVGYDDGWEDGCAYGEITFARTMLECIGEKFEYPCMKEND